MTQGLGFWNRPVSAAGQPHSRNGLSANPERERGRLAGDSEEFPTK